MTGAVGAIANAAHVVGLVIGVAFGVLRFSSLRSCFMKLGFVSAILPDYTLEQVLSFARQAGFSSVELMCWPPGKSERRYAGVSTSDVTNLSAGCDRRESRICSRPTRWRSRAWAIIPTRCRPIRPRPRSRQPHLRKVIDAAAALGVGVVNTFIGRDPGSVGREPTGRDFSKSGGRSIAHAESKGIKIGIENCPMLFTADEWPGGKNLATTPAIWRRMFHDIPSPNFGLNFDPSHLIWQQIDYVAPLAEFKDRIFHVHAKDARIDRSRARSARRPVLSQAVAHAQDSRPGRHSLGRILRRLERCRLLRARRHRGRGPGLRGLDRIAARLARDQPSLLASVLSRLISDLSMFESFRIPDRGSGS